MVTNVEQLITLNGLPERVGRTWFIGRKNWLRYLMCFGVIDKWFDGYVCGLRALLVLVLVSNALINLEKKGTLFIPWYPEFRVIAVLLKLKGSFYTLVYFTITEKPQDMFWGCKNCKNKIILFIQNCRYRTVFMKNYNFEDFFSLCLIISSSRFSFQF